MADAIAVRWEWITSRCRAMYCKALWTWTDEYGNGWCEQHGSGERVCQRAGCGGSTDGRIAWCEEHAYRQELVDLAISINCPLVTLVDGRVVAPGVPVYASVAKWYGERDFCLVFGALLAHKHREYC